jgi:soluble cytochrome b562
MKKTIESITKWLRESSLSVNRAKSEVCTFHKTEIRRGTIPVDGINIVTKNEMNILLVQFDTRLSWAQQGYRAIQKANKALNAIKLIRRFFITNEHLQLCTSNYFSILYYSCKV